MIPQTAASPSSKNSARNPLQDSAHHQQATSARQTLLSLYLLHFHYQNAKIGSYCSYCQPAYIHQISECSNQSFRRTKRYQQHSVTSFSPRSKQTLLFLSSLQFRYQSAQIGSDCSYHQSSDTN